MWLLCGVFLGEGADGRYCCRIRRGVRSERRFVDVLHWVGGRSVVILSEWRGARSDRLNNHDH